MFLNDVPVGYIYSIVYKNNYYVYLLGTLKSHHVKGHSLVKIMIYETLNHAIQQKLHVYDFMSGNENYKYEWTSLSNKVYCVVKTPKICSRFFHMIRYIYLYRMYQFKKMILFFLKRVIQ